MQNRSAPSLADRAILAIALFAGFYILAIGISAALLAIPWVIYQTTGRIAEQIGLTCIVGAAIILYSVIPRVDRFVPPGPRLNPGEHLKLFALIRRVANATGQSIPSDVYLVGNMNAFVTHRGGILGFGGKRVMGLGLPTFQTLSVAELAAVLAHEFGHYHQGDTTAGPWLYKTREAMERTVDNLEKRESILVIPFLWYAKKFMRITMALSRNQEFGADALAVRVTGRAALAGGLERLHGADPLYDEYWSSELVPVLMSGRRPPIAHGFAHFLAQPNAEAAFEKLVKIAKEAPGDEFDSHPPLAERLNALPRVDGHAMLELDHTSKAIGLLANIERLEKELLDFIATDDAPKLEPIEWSAVEKDVWIPFWQERVNEAAGRLKGVSPAELAHCASDPTYLAVRLGFAARASVTTEEHIGDAVSLFAAALCVLLVSRQWSLRAQPGEDVCLTHGELRIRPFKAYTELTSGALAASEWESLCQRAGIARTELALLKKAS